MRYWPVCLIAFDHNKTPGPALGLANISSAFFQSMPVGGGTSGPVMSERGGGSQRPSLFASLLVLITLVWPTPLFHDLPESVLAAIVIHAIAHLANFSEMRRYAKLKTGELPPALTALVAMPTLGIFPGLLLSVGLMLVVLLLDLINSHAVGLGRMPDTRGTFQINPSPHPKGGASCRVASADFRRLYHQHGTLTER
ncbi:MAG: SulP family inorganic anion transporter [Rugosibacter sp.]|jgi:MFS superfamily sulfate permease-like transporter